jgi:FkbM family methyltransferase
MGLGPVLERLAPRTLWRRRLHTWRLSTGEAEAELLPRLASSAKISIDVGAARGAYTASLVPLSSQVVAFEAIPEKAQHLREMFGHTRCVSIHAVALSDRDAEATLRVPSQRSWRSTIEEANPLEGADITEIRVRCARLDSFELRNVGFIKIDVEGHELAVLQGARDTILRNRPNLLIEAEERHRRNAVESVQDFMHALEYRGCFLWSGKVRALGEFDSALYQDVNNLEGDHRVGTYINNFVFLPQESCEL